MNAVRGRLPQMLIKKILSCDWFCCNRQSERALISVLHLQLENRFARGKRKAPRGFSVLIGGGCMSENVASSFRDLKVWQKGMELAKEVFKQAKKLPREELYELSSQMRRAATSIPSNISEGHSRSSTREYLNFLSIARGSCAELQTQLLLSVEFGYLMEKRYSGCYVSFV